MIYAVIGVVILVAVVYILTQASTILQGGRTTPDGNEPRPGRNGGDP